jgi:hypothetical protein
MQAAAAVQPAAALHALACAAQRPHAQLAHSSLLPPVASALAQAV